MGKKILIVDDEPDILSTFKKMLERDSYDVVTARDGLEGIEKVRSERPDLVITDVIMPEKDGAELIFDLQKEFPGIKMIIMTGGQGDAQSYIKSITTHSQVKHGFEKPFDMDEMLRTVKQVLAEE